MHKSVCIVHCRNEFRFANGWEGTEWRRVVLGGPYLLFGVWISFYFAPKRIPIIFCVGILWSTSDKKTTHISVNQQLNERVNREEEKRNLSYLIMFTHSHTYSHIMCTHARTKFEAIVFSHTSHDEQNGTPLSDLVRYLMSKTIFFSLSHCFYCGLPLVLLLLLPMSHFRQWWIKQTITINSSNFSTSAADSTIEKWKEEVEVDEDDDADDDREL